MRNKRADPEQVFAYAAFDKEKAELRACEFRDLESTPSGNDDMFGRVYMCVVCSACVDSTQSERERERERERKVKISALCDFTLVTCIEA